MGLSFESHASRELSADALLDEFVGERAIADELLWSAHDWMTRLLQTLEAEPFGDLTPAARRRREHLRMDLTTLRAHLAGHFTPRRRES